MIRRNGPRHVDRAVIELGDLVEDYPDDSRGHSCLMLGFGGGGRPIHVVCAPKDEYPHEWAEGFRQRRLP